MTGSEKTREAAASVLARVKKDREAKAIVDKVGELYDQGLDDDAIIREVSQHLEKEGDSTTRVNERIEYCVAYCEM